MKTFLQKNARALFYSAWLILGIIQALFTELQDDEAYYWVYAHYLDWGYFDHPPMIALLIKMGGWLFGGALGVRLLPLLLNTATFLITESLLKDRDKILFYALCLSVAVLQVTGFWAVPDVPLLFFTALFFWCYKRFVQNYSLTNTVLLGVACAAMLYTKYHAVLIIFFTLLSDLSLFRRWQTYAAGLLALVLFTPHLWWQYQHDWISVRYHLFESNVNKYKFSYTTDYILGQIAIAGPLAGVIFLWATFTYKTKDKLERALKFTGVGILLFFLLSSFKGKVEANWTAPAIIPMLVLTHHFLQQRDGWRKWLYRLLPATLVITFIFRVAMVVDLIPAETMVKRFHAWEGWPRELKAKTKDLPIVFNNSYQRASQTWFRTGKMTYSLNSHVDRRNNYNFWPVEDSLLGKPVYILDIYNIENYPDSVKGRLWTVGIRYDSSFHAFGKVFFSPLHKGITAKEGAPLVLNVTVTVPPHYKTYLQQHPEVNMPIVLGVFQKRDWIKDIPLSLTLQDVLKQDQIQLSIPHGLQKGDYFVRLAIGSDSGLYTHNSDKINVTVD